LSELNLLSANNEVGEVQYIHVQWQDCMHMIFGIKYTTKVHQKTNCGEWSR